MKRQYKWTTLINGFSIIFLLLSAIRVSAQTATERAIFAQARRDVAGFRLKKTDLKKFKENKKNYLSDYFKPVKSMVSDSTLLNDSNFVKAYRRYAYIKTKSKANTDVPVIIAGAVLLGCLIGLYFDLQTMNF